MCIWFADVKLSNLNHPKSSKIIQIHPNHPPSMQHSAAPNPIPSHRCFGHHLDPAPPWSPGTWLPMAASKLWTFLAELRAAGSQRSLSLLRQAGDWAASGAQVAQWLEEDRGGWYGVWDMSGVFLSFLVTFFLGGCRDAKVKTREMENKYKKWVLKYVFLKKCGSPPWTSARLKC